MKDKQKQNKKKKKESKKDLSTTNVGALPKVEMPNEKDITKGVMD